MNYDLHILMKNVRKLESLDIFDNHMAWIGFIGRSLVGNRKLAVETGDEDGD